MQCVMWHACGVSMQYVMHACGVCSGFSSQTRTSVLLGQVVAVPSSHKSFLLALSVVLSVNTIYIQHTDIIVEIACHLAILSSLKKV